MTIEELLATDQCGSVHLKRSVFDDYYMLFTIERLRLNARTKPIPIARVPDAIRAVRRVARDSLVKEIINGNRNGSIAIGSHDLDNYYCVMIYTRLNAKRHFKPTPKKRTLIYNKLTALQSGLCLLCGNTLVEPSIEHIIPRSKGGTNILSNLAISCSSCNRSRRSNPLTLEQYNRLNDWYYYVSVEIV